MKSSAICFLLLSVLFVHNDKMNFQLILKTKQRHHPTSDSLHVKKDLPIVVADTCIENLLAAVAKSNSAFYNHSKSFFGVYLNNRKNYTYLEIFVDEWKDANYTTYAAAIKLKNTVFLCCGDIKDNPLFHKTNLGIMPVNLCVAKKSSRLHIPSEPSLQGTFRSCKGLPIYVEVYTIKPISGYKMQVKH